MQKIMDFHKNIGKNISKNVSGKYNQRHFDHAKKSSTDAPKTSSKRVIQKIAETTSDLIGGKIAYRVTKVSRSLPQYNSETIANGHDRETPKDIYISPKERQKIINHIAKERITRIIKLDLKFQC